MIASGGQQRNSAILIHVSILPQNPLQSWLLHHIERKSISYMWNLKRHDTKELTKQRLTDLEQTYDCRGWVVGEGRGEGIDREFEMGMYTLLYFKKTHICYLPPPTSPQVPC